MKTNLYAPTPTVGGFENHSRGELEKTLASLSECFNSEYHMDYVSNIKDIMQNESLKDTYSQMMLEDYHNFETGDQLSEQLHQLNVQKLEQLFENSANEVLEESASAALNPVVGLTFPLIKKTWIENIFKDYLQCEIATTPVINRQIERLFMKDSEGKKYYIPEIFEDGGEEAEEALGCADRKLFAGDIDVPKVNYDLMASSSGSIRQRDYISRNFRVAEVTIQNGDSDEDVVSVKVNVKPRVDTNDFSEPIVVPKKDNEHEEVMDMLFGHLNYETGHLSIACTSGKIKKIKVAGTLSSENNMKSASVDWETTNKQFVIPEGRHFNTGLTKERLKNDKVLYNVDSTSKAITDMSLVINQFKDMDMKKHVEEAKASIQNNKKLYISTTYDCKPQGNYAQTTVEYRALMLKEVLDNMAIELKKVFRTPNVFFSIIGNPRDVRLLGDINWGYTSGADVVGGCQMQYSFGVMNSQHKFLVLSSDKIPQGNLRMIVRPTTDEYISFIHYDYNFIISNDYRDPNMPNVPSVMATASYLTDNIVPIIGDIKILNNTLSPTEMWG